VPIFTTNGAAVVDLQCRIFRAIIAGNYARYC
jgi:hypothetical protein